jgi:tripartite-type tricarboxylate transporter receptor subunit TctC
VGWDRARDFVPIGLTVVTTNVLTVHPSLPVKSVKALIAPANAPSPIIHTLHQEIRALCLTH